MSIKQLPSDLQGNESDLISHCIIVISCRDCIVIFLMLYFIYLLFIPEDKSKKIKLAFLYLTCHTGSCAGRMARGVICLFASLHLEIGSKEKNDSMNRVQEFFEGRRDRKIHSR